MQLLVIEDEEKIARFIKRGLVEAGYAVEWTAKGEDGLFLGGSERFAAIILDLKLPDLDGIILCRRLRQAGVRTPILMLTARDAVVDKVKGLDAGADDYLAKPFAFAELLARLRALIRRERSGSPSTTLLQVADLVMDLVSREVRRGGRPVSLTNREFGLLEYLLSNAHCCVTRTMISERVWGIQFDTYTNVIDVYIRYLRAKIDSGWSLKLIHTLRGRGYMLTDHPQEN